MKKHISKYKKEYISVLVLLVTVSAILFALLQLWRFDISIPIKYNGQDEMSAIVNAKLLQEQLWCNTTDKLGAPFGASYYDFAANLLHNSDLITTKIIVMVVRNPIIAYNLNYLLIFFMVAVSSYYVMRKLKIANWISICGALAYSFMPYLFIRSTEHLVLTTCYFVPLSVLLCIWIYEDDEVLRFNKDFFKYKKNILIILFCILIANNGIAYYPFFTCYILGITAVSKLIKSRKLSSVVKPFAAIFCICAVTVMNLIPMVINNMNNGKNPIAVVRGGFFETEIYGLKIAQLLLPVNGHNVPYIEKLIKLYNTSAPMVNENISSYLGIIGVCGFFALIAVLCKRKSETKYDRLELLSELNIFMVLLGMMSGICTIFSFLVSDMLRAYNRISIYIAFVCVLTVALLLNEFYKKHRTWKVIAVCTLITILTVFEQYPAYCQPKYESTKKEFVSDKKMVEELEDNVSEGAMIFELPYHGYPEGGNVFEMADYHLFIGYIHSKNLKWSYGGIKGRDSDKWNAQVAQLELPKMLDTLKESGFEAIYIDRRAYEEWQINQLEENLSRELGNQVIISDNANLSYILLK